MTFFHTETTPNPLAGTGLSDLTESQHALLEAARSSDIKWVQSKKDLGGSMSLSEYLADKGNLHFYLQHDLNCVGLSVRDRSSGASLLDLITSGRPDPHNLLGLASTAQSQNA